MMAKLDWLLVWAAVVLTAVLTSPVSAAVNAMLGTTVNSSSTIMGRGSLNAVLGQSLASSGGGCTTVFAQNASAHSDYVNVGVDAGTYFVGQSEYNPGANVSVCGVEFYITSVGTVSGNTYTCQIWTNSGSNLGVLQGTSAGVAGSNGWSLTVVRFDFSPAISLTSGTNYAIVVSKGAAADGANYVRLSRSAAGGFGGISAWFGSAGTRTNWGSTDFRLIVYTP